MTGSLAIALLDAFGTRGFAMGLRRIGFSGFAVCGPSLRYREVWNSMSSTSLICLSRNGETSGECKHVLVTTMKLAHRVIFDSRYQCKSGPGICKNKNWEEAATHIQLSPMGLRFCRSNFKTIVFWWAINGLLRTGNCSKTDDPGSRVAFSQLPT